MCGYTGRLYGDGSWKLMDMENVAAEGILSQVNPKEWNHLKLIVLGNSIFFSSTETSSPSTPRSA